MRVIGFHFEKISGERLKETSENLKIKTSMDIFKVREVEKPLLKTKDTLIEVNFEYIISYEPELAKVDLKGVMLLAVDKKTSKEILDGWKDKKIPEDVRIQLLNIILRKATIKALELEDVLNLPLHMPMPSFKKEEKSDL